MHNLLAYLLKLKSVLALSNIRQHYVSDLV